MQQANQSLQNLDNTENLKVLANVLKTNVAACGSIGAGFFSQLGRIYLDLLGVYKAVSQLISESVVNQGPVALRTPRVRQMRTVKKEILRLIETYISKADDLTEVTQKIIPGVLEAVLGDYQRNVEPARDAEVLSVMSTIVSKLGVRMTPCLRHYVLSIHRVLVFVEALVCLGKGNGISYDEKDEADNFGDYCPFQRLVSLERQDSNYPRVRV